MNRRDFMAAGTAALFTHAEAAAQPAGASGLRLAARNAWLWGLPLIEMAGQRAARSTQGLKVNTLHHQRALVGAKDQFVTTPNNDTLYSQAWLNLEKGPVTVSVPASGDRYYCVPLMDMYTNNFAIVGTRTSGSAARTFTIVGPHDRSDAPQVIRSPTDWVWLLGRTLVEGEDDLAKAHAFQDGWTISGPEADAPKSFAKRASPWDEYFASVQALMNESPPPVTDARMLDSMAPLIRLGARFDPQHYSADQVADIRAGMADALVLLRQVRNSALVHNGWTFPRYSLGDFGQDYIYRTAVAIGGLAALPRVEAMYLRAAGEDGGGFDSARSWRLTFAADQLPPVDSFWSLSMYRLAPAGQLFFTENPISRYAIGDRTAGLKRGSDGSFEIWMSRTEPTSNPNANWLPAPADDKFVLILRAYLPRSSLIEGSYLPPAVQAV
ncbi:MAG TPA: DUF1254 domain-containing protein [Bradyrhizobium sp.]|uniref:DUF1254 domain-containing protein n=1 Tax=Bradyrhizobium sp. TaxID=376 RepID=UPI002B5D55FF|nr:DUF1254 domain-containing protein [Bradyrhizobium sp.]HLZ02018.1 DUF1254 domain-containing protein [Bradyrhizobium sp.]